MEATRRRGKGEDEDEDENEPALSVQSSIGGTMIRIECWSENSFSLRKGRKKEEKVSFGVEQREREKTSRSSPRLQILVARHSSTQHQRTQLQVPIESHQSTLPLDLPLLLQFVLHVSQLLQHHLRNDILEASSDSDLLLERDRLLVVSMVMSSFLRWSEVVKSGEDLGMGCLEGEHRGGGFGEPEGFGKRRDGKRWC